MRINRLSISFLFTLLIAFGLYGQANAQGSFEGSITLQIKTPQLGDDPAQAVASIKGGMGRFDIDMGAMGKIELFINKDKKTVTTVMESMKMGREMDMPDEAPVADSVASKSLTSTGKTDVINGFHVQEFTANSAAGPMDIWATPDIDASVRAALHNLNSASSRGGGQGIYQALNAKGLTPVRTISSMAGGTTTVDVMKIEPKKIDDSIFAIPADVKVTHLTPEQLKQMQGGGGGGGN